MYTRDTQESVHALAFGGAAGAGSLFLKDALTAPHQRLTQSADEAHGPRSLCTAGDAPFATQVARQRRHVARATEKLPKDLRSSDWTRTQEVSFGHLLWDAPSLAKRSNPHAIVDTIESKRLDKEAPILPLFAPAVPPCCIAGAAHLGVDWQPNTTTTSDVVRLVFRAVHDGNMYLVIKLRAAPHGWMAPEAAWCVSAETNICVPDACVCRSGRCSPQPCRPPRRRAEHRASERLGPRV